MTVLFFDFLDQICPKWIKLDRSSNSSLDDQSFSGSIGM